MVVEVTIDRALGTAHPDYPDMIYPVNYGYIKGVMAGDGEEQDAYVLGVDTPISKFAGKVCAIIHRANDNESKWVVCAENKAYSLEEIKAATYFTEQYFCSQIEMI